MGKIWLKSTDPNKQCCGCEGKTSPCDPCCPSISMTSGQNVYPSGIYTNKLKYSPFGSILATEASLLFSDSDSKLSISGPNYTSAPTSPCSYGGTNENDGIYTVLFTINSGEQLKVDRECLGVSDYIYGDIYFYPADPLGTKCTPSPLVPDAPIIGSYYTKFSAGGSSLKTDQYATTGVGGVVTLKQYYLGYQITNASGPANENQGYSLDEIHLSPGRCLVVTGAYALPRWYAYNNILTSGVVNNTLPATSYSFKGSSISFAASCSVNEYSYSNLGNCSVHPLSRPDPWAVGKRISHTIQVTNILQVQRPQGQAAPMTGIKPVKNVCVEMDLTNKCSIQLLDKDGNQISLKKRLRSFKVL